MGKETPGITFDVFARRIFLLNDHENLNKKQPKKVSQNRLQVVRGEMKMTPIQKATFARFNSVLSLPVAHPYLQKFRQCKNTPEETIERLLEKIIYDMLPLENNAILENDRLRILKIIFL